MAERTVHTKTIELVAWTAISGTLGATGGFLLYRFGGVDVRVGAIAALFVDALLLSLAREGASAVAALAGLLDNSSAKLRDRWMRYLEEVHREIEAALVLQYSFIVCSAVFLGATLPGMSSLTENLSTIEVSPIASAIVGGAIVVGCLPSLLRIVAAPRRVLRLRFDLSEQVMKDRTVAESAEQAMARGRASARLLQLAGEQAK